MKGYRFEPGLSQSELKAFMNDPELYWLRRRGLVPPVPDTPAMQFGRFLEQLLSGNHEEQFVEIPDELLAKNGSRNTKAYREWEEQQDGDSILVKPAEAAALRKKLALCRDQIEQHEAANGLLNIYPGEWHKALFWHDPLWGNCKAELDRHIVTENGSVVVDLKTTADPSPAAFARTVEQLKYYVQAAFYCAAVLESLGEIVTSFYFVAVKNVEPHNVEVYELDEAYLERGTQWINHAVRLFRQAEDTGIYRSPTWGQVVTLEAPGWAQRQDEKDAELWQ